MEDDFLAFYLIPWNHQTFAERIMDYLEALMVWVRERIGEDQSSNCVFNYIEVRSALGNFPSSLRSI